MKKKTAAAILCVAMTAATLTACDSASDLTDSTEALESTETSIATYIDSIVYDVADYVTLGDYKNMEIELNASDYEVTEEDLIDEVNYQIEYAGTYYVDTDKTVVEDGDVVDIDYVGTKDGEAFDGGTASGQKLEIGSGSFIDGFEDGLIGANVGDTVELNLTFPENYGVSSLAGEDVVFTVTINKIVTEGEMDYDRLTDEYVKEYQGMDDVDSFIEAVRSDMEDAAETTKTTDIQKAILDKLLEICDISGYPDGLVDERISQRTSYYENYASMYGVDLETFLNNYMGVEMSDFEQQLEDNMPDAVAQEMILLAIANAEGFADDEEAYQSFVDETISEGGYESEDAFYEIYDKSFVKRNFCQDKALEFLVENVKVVMTEDDTEAVDATETVEITETEMGE